jgi:hypothetical protein
MKKIIWIVAFIIVVGLAGYFFYQKVPQKKLVADPKNESYIIEGEKATYFGNEVVGDFNNDGINDSAFILTQNTGGSGTFFYVAADVSSQNSFVGTNAILLGDRIAPQTTEFKDGQIIVNYADRKPGEAMTATPSVGISRYFKIESAKLVEIGK